MYNVMKRSAAVHELSTLH